MAAVSARRMFVAERYCGPSGCSDGGSLTVRPSTLGSHKQRYAIVWLARLREGGENRGRERSLRVHIDGPLRFATHPSASMGDSMSGSRARRDCSLASRTIRFHRPSRFSAACFQTFFATLGLNRRDSAHPQFGGFLDQPFQAFKLYEGRK